MRILHVIGAMDRGGAETMIMNLYRNIDRDVLQFDFLVHELRECDYDQEILELGGRLFRLPRFNGINALSYRRLCREFFHEHPEYQVVHGHIASSASIYLDEAQKQGRFAIAHSHAQNFIPGLAGLGFAAVTRTLRYHADYFIACSREAGVDLFGEEIVAGGNFHMLLNAIDLANYACDDPQHRLAKEKMEVSGRPVFGHVGRFAEEKNHLFLIEVFDRILDELPDAVLLLVGRGPLENKVRREVESRGLSGSVRFLGVCENVPEVLKAMDVFVFPSIKEGLSMVSVEAQAAGLPELMSTGVPELAVVSCRAQRIALDDGAEVWAKECVDACRQALARSRNDSCDEVRAHGFDIADTAAWLTRFYLEHEKTE